jgi:hypothetical protein
MGVRVRSNHLDDRLEDRREHRLADRLDRGRGVGQARFGAPGGWTRPGTAARDQNKRGTDREHRRRYEPRRWAAVALNE